MLVLGNIWGIWLVLWGIRGVLVGEGGGDWVCGVGWECVGDGYYDYIIF